MAKHHVIISGTGRAGTTVLVQLLTVLGLDIGFTDPNSGVLPNCNAGLEFDIRFPAAPYVVKSPWMCDYLDELLESGSVVIDHTIIPIRDLFAAAESRRDVTRRGDASLYPDNAIPGGLWHTNEPEKQEAVLTVQLYKLIYALARWEVPLTLLHFPRFIYEPEYLYKHLAPIFGLADYCVFLKAFNQVVKPELVHDFTR